MVRHFTADEAKAYADLPSHEELIAKLVFVVASPPAAHEKRTKTRCLVVGMANWQHPIPN